MGYGRITKSGRRFRARIGLHRQLLREPLRSPRHKQSIVKQGIRSVCASAPSRSRFCFGTALEGSGDIISEGHRPGAGHQGGATRLTAPSAAILAGHAGGVKTGMHSMLTGAVGDLYLTLAEEVMGAQAGKWYGGARASRSAGSPFSGPPDGTILIHGPTQ